MSGPPIENGTVLIRDGKIVAVGANVAIPADAQRIDATGKWVTPGLVNAATQLGAGGDRRRRRHARASRAQGSDGIAAAFTSWDGLNPQSVLLAPAREGGITSVVVVAGGRADLRPGGDRRSRAAARARDMLLQGAGRRWSPTSDDAAANGVRARGELIVQAARAARGHEVVSTRRADVRARADAPVRRRAALDLEAMIPVLEGTVPLIINADQASDIEAALQPREGVRHQGHDRAAAPRRGWWPTSSRRRKVPVLTGAMNNIPGELRHARPAAGERRRCCAKAGVQVALIGNAGGGDEELFNVRNIRYEAGNAVAYGMTWDDALRAVTLAPAEIFGVADRVGSLAAGHARRTS